MKKLLGILILLALCLIVCGASATTVPGGTYKASELREKAAFPEIDGDATILLDYDCCFDGITCTGELTFDFSDVSYCDQTALYFSVSSGEAVSAKKILFTGGVKVIFPSSYYIGGSSVIAGGETISVTGPANKVVLGDSDWAAYGLTGVSTIDTSSFNAYKNKILMMNDLTINLDKVPYLGLMRIYDPTRSHKLTVNIVDPDAMLMVSATTPEREAVRVGQIVLGSGVGLSAPEGGRISGGTVTWEDGTPSFIATFCQAGAYTIEPTDCEIVNLDNVCLAENTANPGDTIKIESIKSLPTGKYLDSVESDEVTVTRYTDPAKESMLWFTMPAQNVKLKGINKDQVPCTLDLIGKDEIGNTAVPGLTYTMDLIVAHKAKSDTIDGKKCFDLDKDGNYDLWLDTGNAYKILDTCNLTEWTADGYPLAKYCPVTFLFKQEYCTVSFDANGGTGAMADVTVAKHTSYTLPECAFTPPAGKVFDMWDKGVPGGTIDITGDVTVKALWKDLYTVSFDANGGTGAMDSVIVAKNESYTLPECAFTTPADMVVDKWDKGAVGDSITVTGDVTVKALWTDGNEKEVTVAGCVYRINRTTMTAVFLRQVKKNSKKLTIPDTITDGSDTFAVTEIAKNACSGRKKLKQVVIGANVEKIGMNAFKNCSRLKKVTIKTEKLVKANIGKNSFKGTGSGVTYKCPKGYKKNYKKWLTKKGKASKSATYK